MEETRVFSAWIPLVAVLMTIEFSRFLQVEYEKEPVEAEAKTFAVL